MAVKIAETIMSITTVKITDLTGRILGEFYIAIDSTSNKLQINCFSDKLDGNLY